MKKRLICMCNFVTEQEIFLLLRKGASNTSDIQFITRAGTLCGKCLPEIDELVSDYKANHDPASQGRLPFG